LRVVFCDHSENCLVSLTETIVYSAGYNKFVYFKGGI
jgi:hypothetical protein